ncbi:MAG: hypothetical protein J7J52_04775 [Deltaproteobacteria bacterium]|nr:hypothetical protein [Deltaproteobacteria bacterium]
MKTDLPKDYYADCLTDWNCYVIFYAKELPSLLRKVIDYCLKFPPEEYGTLPGMIRKLEKGYSIKVVRFPHRMK